PVSVTWYTRRPTRISATEPRPLPLLLANPSPRLGFSSLPFAYVACCHKQMLPNVNHLICPHVATDEPALHGFHNPPLCRQRKTKRINASPVVYMPIWKSDRNVVQTTERCARSHKLPI